MSEARYVRIFFAWKRILVVERYLVPREFGVSLNDLNALSIGKTCDLGVFLRFVYWTWLTAPPTRRSLSSEKIRTRLRQRLRGRVPSANRLG